MDEKTYKIYKRRIAEAKSVIDNKPPKFDLSHYYKTANLDIDAARIKVIDAENIKLLRRMNVINRIGGTTDCWLPKIEYASRFVDQERTNRTIMRQNKALLKSIRNTTSQYPAAEFIKSWQNMRMKLMHGRRKVFIFY
nr:PREDICTED: uncharacterized protein LOC105661798 [Megachile rotundata]